MNTKEYIESGTLELYVSGLLSIEEMYDVELKACQFPEIKAELEALQTSMQQYAMKHAIMPSPSLKNRVMNAIEKKETVSASNQSNHPEKVSTVSYHIFNPDWLLKEDEEYKQSVPFRMFNSDGEIGYSDHLPLYLELSF